MKLEGKKAIVTGASRGIGAAIALRLAKDGADVALTYNASEVAARKIADQIKDMGRNVYFIKADASKPENLEQPITELIKKLGGLDILVNNAGIGRGGHIEATSLGEFDETLDVNVRSVFETTRICVPHLKSGGRIIIMGSILGERSISGNITAYNTSKFAVAGLGRSIAHDLGPKNITVNVIQPGPIDTDMNPDDGSENARDFIEMTPLGRYGKPEEIASVAAFLASDDASYITGATINVDGGVNA